jgi:hypothetical protein
LSDRDRAVLELAFRHGLNGPDLAQALEVTAATANTIVKRLRDTIERSLGALLVSRRVRNSGGCHELELILDGWDGSFNVLMRKRISRHIESCDICDEQRSRLVTPAALLGTAPVFVPAPGWLRERTLNQIQLTSASGPTDDGGDGACRDQVKHEDRGTLFPAAAFLIALLAAVGLSFVWVDMQKVSPQTPVEVSETAPSPAASTPPGAPPPTPTPSVKTVPSSAAPFPEQGPTVEFSSPAPTPVAPPQISTPPLVSPPGTSAPPASPPPLPPAPDWTDWLPPWPPAPQPPQPPQPPSGGGFTAPGGLIAPSPGGSVVPQ